MRGPGSDALAAQSAALFASDLSALCEHTRIEIAAAIRHAIGTHHGFSGCAAEVAAAYGEYPETAAPRMCWARAVVEGNKFTRRLAASSSMTATPPVTAGTAPQPAADPDGEVVLGTSLVEPGYVHARFGGMPVLVGPTLAAQLKALRERQP